METEKRLRELEHNSVKLTEALQFALDELALSKVTLEKLTSKVNKLIRAKALKL